MSPEQASGPAPWTPARTSSPSGSSSARWSPGSPSSGVTPPAQVLAAVIERDPEPLRRLRPGRPRGPRGARRAVPPEGPGAAASRRPTSSPRSWPPPSPAALEPGRSAGCRSHRTAAAPRDLCGDRARARRRASHARHLPRPDRNRPVEELGRREGEALRRGGACPRDPRRQADRRRARPAGRRGALGASVREQRLPPRDPERLRSPGGGAMARAARGDRALRGVRPAPSHRVRRPRGTSPSGSGSVWCWPCRRWGPRPRWISLLQRRGLELESCPPPGPAPTDAPQLSPPRQAGAPPPAVAQEAARVRALIEQREGRTPRGLMDEVDGIVRRAAELAARQADLEEQTSETERAELGRSAAQARESPGTRQPGGGPPALRAPDRQSCARREEAIAKADARPPPPARPPARWPSTRSSSCASTSRAAPRSPSTSRSSPRGSSSSATRSTRRKRSRRSYAATD